MSSAVNSDSFDSDIKTESPAVEGEAGALLKDISVTVLPSVQRLLQDDILTLGTSNAELFCAKNETEAFQIIVTNKSDETLPDIEIHVSDWQGPAGTKPKLTLFREHYVQTTAPSYGLPANTPVGWYPDALIPFVDPYTGEPITKAKYLANHQSVVSKTSQGYWADVRVDSDVPAGTYTCSILVTSQTSPIAEIPVTLTVWDFALPKHRQFITWWYGFYNIHQYYGLPRDSGRNYDTLMERYRDMVYEHGIYPAYQSGGRVYDAQSGNVKFTPQYFRNIDAFVNKYGTGILLIPTGWLAKDWVLESDSKILNTLNSYNDMIKEHLNRNGKCEHGQYVVYLDEPYKPERMAAVKKIKDLMNTIPDLYVKMMLTGSQYAYDILDSQGHRCADLWVCYGQEVVDRHTRNPVACRSIGDLSSTFLHDVNNPDAVLWTNMLKGFADVNLLQYCDFSWYGYTQGMTGGFGWKLAVSSTDHIDPWVESRTYIDSEHPSRAYNGFTSQIYPGNSSRVGISGIGGPIATMRLKTWRRACEDFEYFKLLEGLTNKATVDAIVSGVVQSYSTYANLEAYAVARNQIAQLILKNQ